MKQPSIKTVLIVDDEYHILEMLCDMLEISGYECLKASDGEEAYEIFKKNKNTIDLLIVDILMPKMSGIDLYKELIIIKKDINIIFISGYTEKDEIKEFLQNNKLPCINKPFQFDVLLEKIKIINN